MHEPDSWDRVDRLPLFAERSPERDEVEFVEKYCEGFSAVTREQVTSKLPIFRKSYQSAARFELYKASIYLAKLGGRVGVRINPVSRLPKADKPYVCVWKSIESLGRLPLLAGAIKDGHCVHIVRNPAGYVASVLHGESKSYFQGATSSSDDYQLYQMLLDTNHGRALGLSMSDLKQLAPVERLAIRWRLYNEIAYDGCVGTDNYSLVIYEDICRDPVGVTRRMFESASLNWNAQTESFVMASVSAEKNAYYSVYKDPLKAAYKWKSSLAASDIDKIVNILRGSTPFSWYESDF